jgi:hypothetical protein
VAIAHRSDLGSYRLSRLYRSFPCSWALFIRPSALRLVPRIERALDRFEQLARSKRLGDRAHRTKEPGVSEQIQPVAPLASSRFDRFRATRRGRQYRESTSLSPRRPLVTMLGIPRLIAGPRWGPARSSLAPFVEHLLAALRDAGTLGRWLNQR